ncbi:phage tail fiber protein [Morganella morganii]
MIYTDGTIAIKAGSPIVTGTGTQWKKNIHGVAPGQLISIENSTAPVSMMIRAVNSDTELVLSFNAPVTLSGAKYSIATTVPDTISDAARTMSANQGYIVYFLQAMQQWMADTGQVEIELPNGQKVTLDSIKALSEAISKIPKVVQGPGDSKTDVMSQGAVIDWVHGMLSNNPDNQTTVVKAVPDSYLWVSGGGQFGYTYKKQNPVVVNAPGSYASLNGTGEYTGFRLTKSDGRYVLLETNPHAGTASMLSIVYRQANGENQHVITVPYDSGVLATQTHVKYSTGFGIGSEAGGKGITDFNSFVTPTGQYWYGNSSSNIPQTVVGFGTALVTRYSNNISHHLIIPNYGGGSYLAIRRNNGGAIEDVVALTSNMYVVDGSGYYKKASPIIQIHPDGNYETNDESEGAEVSRTGTGQYHITGILGYNSDGAWGVNGGISVPKDNNGLELVYVADRVQEDGGIIIETCHRQHAHLPERFQNWRLKEVTPEGERVFWQDGEPCDLPESTRLDVRVEMPQSSVWNVKQRELAEQMEREQEVTP